MKEIFEAIVSNYRYEAKVQAKVGTGAKGVEDIREGGDTRNKKYRE